jgi:hypothetical protein
MGWQLLQPNKCNSIKTTTGKEILEEIRKIETPKTYVS